MRTPTTLASKAIRTGMTTPRSDAVQRQAKRGETTLAATTAESGHRHAAPTGSNEEETELRANGGAVATQLNACEYLPHCLSGMILGGRALPARQARWRKRRSSLAGSRAQQRRKEVVEGGGCMMYAGGGVMYVHVRGRRGRRRGIDPLLRPGTRASGGCGRAPLRCRRAR